MTVLQLPKEIDGDRANELFDETLLLFKKYNINLSDDLERTLELVKCLGVFLEDKCQVTIVDEINPYVALLEILDNKGISFLEEKSLMH